MRGGGAWGSAVARVCFERLWQKQSSRCIINAKLSASSYIFVRLYIWKESDTVLE